jgi:hypothetical protein
MEKPEKGWWRLRKRRYHQALSDGRIEAEGVRHRRGVQNLKAVHHLGRQHGSLYSLQLRLLQSSKGSIITPGLCIYSTVYDCAEQHKCSACWALHKVSGKCSFHNLGCERFAWPGASKDHSDWVHMKYLIPAQPLLSNNQMPLAPYARLPFKSSTSHNTPGIQEFLKRALGALLFKWR